MAPLLESYPAVAGRRGRPRCKPESLLGDRAYGTRAVKTMLKRKGIGDLLAARLSKIHGSRLGVLRYVVEQSLACVGHFRRIRHSYERWAQHFQAFHELAAALLVHARLKSHAVRF
ncbi:MAG: hypothetical protein KF724_00265 [Phycisphaeraceae bacterium]|nr:hypothetical protein [Phycisphaeraceae bacterium]